MGLKIAESTQKAPENLKIRPEPLQKQIHVKFRPTPVRKKQLGNLSNSASVGGWGYLQEVVLAAARPETSVDFISFSRLFYVFLCFVYVFSSFVS